MLKTISEVQGTIGTKKNSKKTKKTLDLDIKTALLSAVALMKDGISSTNPVRKKLSLDLKRNLEVLEKEYGITLI